LPYADLELLGNKSHPECNRIADEDGDIHKSTIYLMIIDIIWRARRVGKIWDIGLEKTQ